MAGAAAEMSAVEERISVASNWTLVWWRFRKHKLALASAAVLAVLYAIVLCPDFFSTQDPERTDARQAFIPIQSIHFLDDGKWAPWVPAAVGKRNPVTLRMEWGTDPARKIRIGFFVDGPEYRFLGLVRAKVRLVGPLDPEQRIFLLGSDRMGRDQWSRIMHGTQTSMTIGLVAVTLSVVLGIVLGGGAAVLGEHWEHSHNRGRRRGPKHRHECTKSCEDDQRRRVEWSGAHERLLGAVDAPAVPVGAACVNDDNIPVRKVIVRPMRTYHGHAIVATPPKVLAIPG